MIPTLRYVLDFSSERLSVFLVNAVCGEGLFLIEKKE
jgi:hypothetical protein